MQKAKQTVSFYTVFNYRYCIKYMKGDSNSVISVTCETIKDVISFSYLHSITEDQNPGVLLKMWIRIRIPGVFRIMKRKSHIFMLRNFS
jgi:hypothetical protein